MKAERSGGIHNYEEQKKDWLHGTWYSDIYHIDRQQKPLICISRALTDRMCIDLNTLSLLFYSVHHLPHSIHAFCYLVIHNIIIAVCSIDWLHRSLCVCVWFSSRFFLVVPAAFLHDRYSLAVAAAYNRRHFRNGICMQISFPRCEWLA